MIATIAQFYVDVLEPGFKIFLVVAVIAFILYGINILRDSKKKTDLVGGLVTLIVKSIIKSMQLMGRLLLGSLKVLLKTSRVIMATVRDFLTSKI